MSVTLLSNDLENRFLGISSSGNYTYIGYASDTSGSDFSEVYDNTLHTFSSVIASASEIPTRTASDFSGQWNLITRYNLSSIEADVDTNTADIAGLDIRVTDNTSDISALQTQVGAISSSGSAGDFQFSDGSSGFDSGEFSYNASKNSLKLGTITSGLNHPGFELSKELNLVSGVGGHGFADATFMDNSDIIEYASFDAVTTAQGTHDYNHIAGMQARQKFKGSGTIDRMTGFQSFMYVESTGTVNRATCFEARDMLGTGTVGTNIGLYVKTLSRGTTSNTAILIGDTDVDQNLITVGVTGSPVFKWDESRDSFSFNRRVISEGKLEADAFKSPIYSDSFSSLKEIDYNDGESSLRTILQTANMTIDFLNLEEGVVYETFIYQDGTGGRTITVGDFNGNTGYPNDNNPSFITTANGVNRIKAIYDGSQTFYDVSVYSA